MKKLRTYKKQCRYLLGNGRTRLNCSKAKFLKINRPICAVCEKKLLFGQDPKSGTPPKFMELSD